MKTSLLNSLRTLLIVALGGWVLSFYTLYHRQRILLQGLEEASFCNINDLFNCDAVTVSKYSAIAGWPTSAIGMAFYAGLTLLVLWTLFRNPEQEKQKIETGLSWILVASLVSLVPTALLAAISIFRLHSICLLCLGIYLINITLALLSLRARKDTHSFSLSGIPSSFWMSALALGALQLFIPSVLDSNLSEGPRPDAATLQAYVAKYLQQPQHENIRTEGFPSEGGTNATLEIVEFSDFQCPYCRKAAATLSAQVLAYMPDAKLVFRNYPLNSACNAAPGMSPYMHPQSCKAAKIGFCVFSEKGSKAFFEYSGAVFSHQDSMNDALLEEQGQKFSGLTLEALRACADSPATHEKILADAAEGQRLDIQGTPAIYINGRFVPSGAQPHILKAILDHLLTKTR